MNNIFNLFSLKSVTAREVQKTSEMKEGREEVAVCLLRIGKDSHLIDTCKWSVCMCVCARKIKRLSVRVLEHMQRLINSLLVSPSGHFCMR